MDLEATIEAPQDETITDNSVDVETQEPSDNGDNSEAQKQEPVENEGGQQEAKPETTFKSFEEAVKSYSELQKKLGETSNELGELRKKAELAEQLQEQLNSQKLQTAQENGFNSVQEFENHQEVVKYEADMYAKCIQECEFPEEMVNMLAEYRRNPSKELLNTIEAEFSVDTVKKVAGDVAILRGQLQQREAEALENQVYNSAREYLDTNVNKYSNEFKNPAFAALYGEAFRAFGCDLDTDKFVSLMNNYATSVIKAAGIKNGIVLENTQATDEIAGLTNNVSNSPRGQEKNILEMTEDEMRKELRKYNK